MSRSTRVTMGEVYRRIEGLERAMQGSFQAIDDRMAETLVQKGAYEAEQKALTERVSQVERWRDTVAGRWWSLWVGVLIAMIAAVGAIVASLIH